MPYIGNTVTTQGFTPAIDYFNGNGVTVTFTLTRPVSSVAQMIVAVDNVIQNPSSAFTVAGNAITFTSAPLTGTNNIWVEYTSLITTYNAISQDPTVIGDITTNGGGFLSTGDFGNAYLSGVIVDYVTGLGRVTVGPSEGVTLYNGGTSARTALAAWDSSGNLTNKGSIGSPAATALTLKSAGTTAVTIDTSQNVGIGTTSNRNSAKLDVRGNTIAFGSNDTYYGQINYDAPSGYFRSYSTDGGFSWIANTTERMRIDLNGNIYIANTNTQIGGDTARFTISGAHNSGYFGIAVNSTTTSGNQNFINFGRGGSQCGYIASTATNSTTYLTSSDYRLKEDIAPMTGALAKVNALKPVTYKWKTDGTDSQGFIAHELAEVCPEAVAGKKDELDADGNPRYQGVDTSFLVATLTAAIQEQQAMIEELKTKVAALEAK